LVERLEVWEMCWAAIDLSDLPTGVRLVVLVLGFPLSHSHSRSRFRN